MLQLIHLSEDSPMLFLPTEYAIYEPVLFAAIIVFIVDLIGNTIAFGSRVVNALVTAIVFAIIFGALNYYGYGSLETTIEREALEGVPTLEQMPTIALPPELAWLEPTLIASIFVFVIGLIGNILAFGSRFVNALVTAILFAIVFGALTHFALGGIAVEIRDTPAENAPANNSGTN